MTVAEYLKCYDDCTASTRGSAPSVGLNPLPPKAPSKTPYNVYDDGPPREALVEGLRPYGSGDGSAYTWDVRAALTWESLRDTFVRFQKQGADTPDFPIYESKPPPPPSEDIENDDIFQNLGHPVGNLRYRITQLHGWTDQSLPAGNKYWSRDRFDAIFVRDTECSARQVLDQIHLSGPSKAFDKILRDHDSKRKSQGFRPITLALTASQLVIVYQQDRRDDYQRYGRGDQLTIEVGWLTDLQKAMQLSMGESFLSPFGYTRRGMIGRRIISLGVTGGVPKRLSAAYAAIITRDAIAVKEEKQAFILDETGYGAGASDWQQQQALKGRVAVALASRLCIDGSVRYTGFASKPADLPMYVPVKFDGWILDSDMRYLDTWALRARLGIAPPVNKLGAVTGPTSAPRFPVLLVRAPNKNKPMEAWPLYFVAKRPKESTKADIEVLQDSSREKDPLKNVWLDTIIRDFMHETGTSGGVVAISRNGVFEVCRGYTNAPPEHDRVGPHTQMRIGSCSKVITALALLSFVRNPTPKPDWTYPARGGGNKPLGLDMSIFDIAGVGNYGTEVGGFYPKYFYDPEWSPSTSGLPPLPKATLRLSIRRLLGHRTGWDREGGVPMFNVGPGPLADGIVNAYVSVSWINAEVVGGDSAFPPNQLPPSSTKKLNGPVIADPDGIPSVYVGMPPRYGDARRMMLKPRIWLNSGLTFKSGMGFPNDWNTRPVGWNKQKYDDGIATYNNFNTALAGEVLTLLWQQRDGVWKYDGAEMTILRTDWAAYAEAVGELVIEPLRMSSTVLDGWTLLGLHRGQIHCRTSVPAFPRRMPDAPLAGSGLDGFTRLVAGTMALTKLYRLPGQTVGDGGLAGSDDYLPSRGNWNTNATQWPADALGDAYEPMPAASYPESSAGVVENAYDVITGGAGAPAAGWVSTAPDLVRLANAFSRWFPKPPGSGIGTPTPPKNVVGADGKEMLSVDMFKAMVEPFPDWKGSATAQERLGINSGTTSGGTGFLSHSGGVDGAWAWTCCRSDGVCISFIFNQNWRKPPAVQIQPPQLPPQPVLTDGDVDLLRVALHAALDAGKLGT